MSTALVPVAEIRNLPAEYREHAVTAYLAAARDRLAEALDATNSPQAVAAIKAEVATVAEMTKQLNLSKECRDDSIEMVRRAEYTLGKAIRKGQEAGAVQPRYKTRAADVTPGGHHLPSPHEIAGEDRRQSMSSIYALSDSVTGDQLEDALADARDEGNLSRANVVRKIRQAGGPQTRDQRADQIEALARQGYTSEQIAPKVGITRQSVRLIARDFDVDIPADRATGKRQRLNSNRILSGAAESVAAAAYSLQHVNPLDLDQEAAREWVDSLTESISAIRKALNPIKESLHVQV